MAVSFDVHGYLESFARLAAGNGFLREVVAVVDGYEIPAIIVELSQQTDRSDDTVLQEVRQLAANHSNTMHIKHFLIHPSFPVDIRHNAKIFREKLGIWATGKLSSQIRFAQEQS